VGLLQPRRGLASLDWWSLLETCGRDPPRQHDLYCIYLLVLYSLLLPFRLRFKSYIRIANAE
jgi:hypothetical protein